MGSVPNHHEFRGPLDECECDQRGSIELQWGGSLRNRPLGLPAALTRQKSSTAHDERNFDSGKRIR